MYLRKEFFAKKAIEFLSLPVFINAWVDKTHKNCIYTPTQLKLWDFHVLQECPWFVDCFASFYPAEEDIERKAIIGSTPLDASQDIFETNNVDIQSMQEGVVTQTEKRKRGKKVVISPTLLNITTDDATITESSSSSNLETLFHASKNQKTIPSPSLDMPPKLRGMMDIVPPLPPSHTSLDLILNDLFVRIIEDKKKTCTFRAPYDDIVVILSKVNSFYFTFFEFISCFIKFTHIL